MLEYLLVTGHLCNEHRKTDVQTAAGETDYKPCQVQVPSLRSKNHNQP